jgi:predicted RNase H-like HicB family nuclease
MEQNDHYSINLFYRDRDGCWVADAPDLKYCTAFGPTPAEALQELEVAKAAWLEAARASGKPIPAPKYRAVIYQLSAME